MELNQLNNVQNQQARLGSAPGRRFNREPGQNLGRSSGDSGFDLFKALGSFAKGVVSPITGLFESRESLLLGIGMIAVGSFLTFLTGGAILPLFIVLGVSFGAVQVGTGIHKLTTARSSQDIENAFEDF